MQRFHLPFYRNYRKLTKTVADGGARASARFDVNFLGGK
jgi:hypothetical protein